MKFENKDPEHLGDAEYAAGVAYDWINERGYQVPARMVTVWSHADAVHDWVLVSGDWFGSWQEVECIPFVPMTYVECWHAINGDKFTEMSRKELDIFMLKMEKEWLEYELESRLPNKKGEEANE